jgi:hypothetical protein
MHSETIDWSQLEKGSAGWQAALLDALEQGNLLVVKQLTTRERVEDFLVMDYWGSQGRRPLYVAAGDAHQWWSIFCNWVPMSMRLAENGEATALRFLLLLHVATSMCCCCCSEREQTSAYAKRLWIVAELTTRQRLHAACSSSNSSGMQCEWSEGTCDGFLKQSSVCCFSSRQAHELRRGLIQPIWQLASRQGKADTRLRTALLPACRQLHRGHPPLTAQPNDALDRQAGGGTDCAAGGGIATALHGHGLLTHLLSLRYVLTLPARRGGVSSWKRLHAIGHQYSRTSNLC